MTDYSDSFNIQKFLSGATRNTNSIRKDYILDVLKESVMILKDKSAVSHSLLIFEKKKIGQ